MSYKLNMLKRKPSAMWLLDDTIPFQEHSGSGFAGTATAAPATSTTLAAGAAWSSVFHNGAIGSFVSPVFKQGSEDKPFALGAWVYPIVLGKQQILSHSGQYDGLWIENNVVNFTTTYLTAGSSTVSYDLEVTQAAYVVGVHTSTNNQLYVNGVLVDSIELTDDQKNDSYIATNGSLYTGNSTNAASRLAVNSIELYNTISSEGIKANFDAGRNVVSQVEVPSQFKGISIALDSSMGSVYFDRKWAVRGDFNNGYNDGVNIGNKSITPVLDSNELSVSGSWTAGVLLDIAETTSIYGVMAEWSGKNVIVEGSVNGTSWTALTSGALVPMITNGYATANKSLQVRARFTAGLAADDAYLESLRLVGYRNNTINSTEVRVITATHPAVTRGDFEPIAYRNDNGVTLNGGTLSIGPDTSADPNVARTVEIWIKKTGGLSPFTLTGTRYINGVANAGAIPQDEWSLVHLVEAANITTDIQIGANAIIGQIALYPTALTAAEIAHIYKSYTGTPVITFSDTNAIGIAESVTPLALYIRDWSIDGAGG